MHSPIASRQRTSRSPSYSAIFSPPSTRTRPFRASRSGKGHLYVTFAREPLQRAISHYHYGDRVELPGHRLWRQFGKERWPLDRFLLSRQKWRMFSPSFFGEFHNPGTSTLSDSQTVTRKAYVLSAEAVPVLRDLKSRSENVNPNSAGQMYTVDASLADAFKKLNVADYRIYEHACTSFERQRRSTKGPREMGLRTALGLKRPNAHKGMEDCPSQRTAGSQP